MDKDVTYDEFKGLVKKWLKPMLKSATEEDIDEYLGAEGQEELRSRYDKYHKEYEDGGLTYEQFTQGCAGSVGYCLYMLY